jgi:hypothetical protein
MNCTSIDILKSLMKIFSHYYFNKVVTKKENRLREPNILHNLVTNATGLISHLQDTNAMMVTKFMVAFKPKYLTNKYNPITIICLIAVVAFTEKSQAIKTSKLEKTLKTLSSLSQ